MGSYIIWEAILKKEIIKFTAGEFVKVTDEVAVEAPLHIFIDGKEQYICLRSPGDDINLAIGLCFADGIIDDFADIDDICVEATEGADKLGGREG